MCLAFKAMEEFARAGGGRAFSDIPTVKLQMDLLTDYSRKVGIPEIVGAASTTVASYQQEGLLDPAASGELATFCRPSARTEPGGSGRKPGGGTTTRPHPEGICRHRGQIRAQGERGKQPLPGEALSSSPLGPDDVDRRGKSG
jgi:hypothetical protein